MSSAPAERSSSRNSGNGSQSLLAPCSCTAIRQPLMPNSRKYRETSREDSDSGDHSSRRPAARSAPVAFGPRATIRALDNAAVNRSASPHPSAAATQPRNPIPVVAITMSGGSATKASVLRRNSSSSDSATMVIAAALATVGAVAAQQRAQLAGTPRRGDCHPVTGERRRGCVIHMNCVCPPNFSAVTDQLLRRCSRCGRSSVTQGGHHTFPSRQSHVNAAVSSKSTPSGRTNTDPSSSGVRVGPVGRQHRRRPAPRQPAAQRVEPLAAVRGTQRTELVAAADHLLARVEYRDRQTLAAPILPHRNGFDVAAAQRDCRGRAGAAGRPLRAR